MRQNIQHSLNQNFAGAVMFRLLESALGVTLQCLLPRSVFYPPNEFPASDESFYPTADKSSEQARTLMVEHSARLYTKRPLLPALPSCRGPVFQRHGGLVSVPKCFGGGFDHYRFRFEVHITAENSRPISSCAMLKGSWCDWTAMSLSVFNRT
jgi:hypothetical protein